MILGKDFINKIINCQWLQMCGIKEDFEYDIEYAKSKKELEKKITSLAWENICLERRGDFTVYLHLNHRTEYDQYWNKEVRIIKSEYMPEIIDKITQALRNKDLSLDILEDMKMNIITLFMLEFYSEYYSSEFFERMLMIYLSGHLPCGWMGKYPKGRFLIY